MSLPHILTHPLGPPRRHAPATTYLHDLLVCAARPARRLVLFHGGNTNPILDRLRSFGQTRGLAFGGHNAAGTLKSGCRCIGLYINSPTNQPTQGSTTQEIDCARR